MGKQSNIGKRKQLIVYKQRMEHRRRNGRFDYVRTIVTMADRQEEEKKWQDEESRWSTIRQYRVTPDW